MAEDQSSVRKSWWFLVGIIAGALGGLTLWLLLRERKRPEKPLSPSAGKGNRDEILIEGPTSIPVEATPRGEVEKEVPFEVSRLSRPYLEAVLSNLDACSQEWHEAAWVRFGTTGKGLRPNYQIESESGKEYKTFSGNTHARRASSQPFRPENLTLRRYSRQELASHT
jgi:hypothetical protein